MDQAAIKQLIIKPANDNYRIGNYDSALNGYLRAIRLHPKLEDILKVNIQLAQQHIARLADIKSSGTVAHSVVLQDAPCENGWKNWSLHQGAYVAADGSLSAKINKSMVLATLHGIPVVRGFVYRLKFDCLPQSESSKFYATLCANGKVSKSYYQENALPIGADTSVRDGSREILFFADEPFDTLNLVGFGSSGEFRLAISNLVVERLGAEDLQQFKPEVDGKIIASMASVPGRNECLKNTILSLYHQVDEVRVFLNNYDEVPSFLLSLDKVKVESSKIWGDQGDSGKFFWADDETPGYRFTCDDDIVYPPDYVNRMITNLQHYNDRVVVGGHGIMLKQPVTDYYGQSQRKVYHFKNSVSGEFSCHILGTGVLAYKQGSIVISKKDFMYRNMADVWLAKLLQEQSVPMVRVATPNNWVREGLHNDGSIWASSFQEKLCPKNTRMVQTKVLNSIEPLSVQPLKKKKVVIGIKTYDRKDYLKDCLESFLKTKSDKYEWAVIIADDGSTDGTLDYIESLSLDVELHVIKNKRRYAVGQTNTILRLAEKIGFDYGFNVDDDLVFTKPGWDELYIDAIDNSGYSHLVHRHLKHAENLLKNQGKGESLPDAIHDETKCCVAYGDAWFDLGTGGLVTFTKDTIQGAGYCDEKNFPIRGQWHVDYHIRCCRAGCNDINALYDAVGSNDYLEIQNYLVDDYRCAIPWGEEYKKTKDAAELERRYKVMRDESRVHVPYPGLETSGQTKRTVTNPMDIADKVYVLNLDRRPDRWQRISKDAQANGLELTRFSACDGAKEPYATTYKEYAAQPLVSVSPEHELKYSFDVYRRNAPDNARVAFFEQKHKRKAIGSVGAWGYSWTMIGILEDALEKGYEQILVLDDDARFHKNFKNLVIEHYNALPDNWLVWQLGALQYQWDDKKWIDWSEKGPFYQCNGSSVGSHAVLLRQEVIPLILDYCKRLDLPYDEGPLHKPKALFPERCLTSYPNLIIQDVTESDISEKTEQLKRGEKIYAQYHWVKSDYKI